MSLTSWFLIHSDSLYAALLVFTSVYSYLFLIIQKIFAILVFFSFSSFAQSDRGNINGTVTDASGGVVPNATVVAKNVETGSVSQAATTGTGNYTIPQLPAGAYELSVHVPGCTK